MTKQRIRIEYRPRDTSDPHDILFRTFQNNHIPNEHLSAMLRNIGDQPIPREVREYIADAIDTRMRERPGPKRDKNQELIKTYRAMRHYDDLLPYIQDCKKNGWADCEIDVSEELRDETPGNIVGTLVTQEFWPHASTRHVLNLISEFRKSGKYPK